MSPTKTGSLNDMASMATVATLPCERWEAVIPAAMSICESTQPPKMSPLGFACLGMASVRRESWPLGFSVIGSTELVQSEAEARNEYLEEVPHFGEVDAPDGAFEGLLRLGELLVSRRHLFEALDVGAELVRGLAKLPVLGIGRIGDEGPPIVLRELLRHHRHQARGEIGRAA